jgi:hypothetical protein
MALPQIALKLISEYSKPCTHPNWRNRQWICVGDIYNEFMSYKNNNNKYDKHYKLYKRFTLNVQNNYNWNTIYECYLMSGITITSLQCKISEKILRKIIYSNIKNYI